MKKKILFSLVLLLNILTTYSQTFTVDFIEYNVIDTENNIVQITDYSGSYTKISIPSYVINNNISYVVAHIGESAFRSNKLTKLTIPNTIKSIGDYAFYDNFLNEVYSLIESPFYISETVFGNDEVLRFSSLKIPEGTSSLYLENNWNWIGGYTEIGYESDFTIDNIQYEIINTEKNTVAVSNFIGYNTDVIIPNNIIFESISYSVIAINANAFYDNNITAVTIPNSVTNIGNYAFYENNLTKITIPNSVTNIGESAFSKNKINNASLSDNITSISDGLFSSNYLTNIIIPENITTIGRRAFHSNYLTSINIPENITSVGSDAFSNNRLTSVIIPENITFIANRAFSNNRLTSIIIPENITSIGNDAFFDNRLANVIIPENVTHIGSYAFSFNSLTSIIIPENITSISSGAFSHNYLTSISIPDNITYIGSHAFSYNFLSNVIISKNVTIISFRAFYSNFLTNITIHENIENIYSEAFSFNNLTSITIPENIENIYSEAFSFNDLTEVISLNDDPIVLISNIFNNKENIDLKIPIGTTEIYTERGWTGFKSVTEHLTLDEEENSLEQELNISITNSSIEITSNTDIKQIQILNTLGQAIETSSVNTINTSILSSGIYIILVETNNGAVTKKFIKQ